MYLRAVHAEHHISTLRRFIHDNPLGLFITAIQSSTSSFPTIQATHVPWLLDVEDSSSETELGILRGHLARPNPHSKALIEALGPSSGNSGATPHNGTLQSEVSIIFNGSAHHYVTPKFYTTTKPSTGKVVPTWNYSAVQVYGTAKVYFDAKNPETSTFLQKQISDLSRHAEVNVMGCDGENGRKKAWGVEDAPERYIELLKKNILGVEVKVTKLEGKWKMSQELGQGDRDGVIAGFRELGTEDGELIAKTVEERQRSEEERSRS
jgi:transcriptional regulator